MPANLQYDYSELTPFFQYSINNIGDPYMNSKYPINSREEELRVISFFCDLYQVDQKEAWGYITNGGTEGNTYGLLLARECFPNSILYFSEDTHYSITKIAKMLRMPYIVVKSLPNGEINYEDFRRLLKKNKNKGVILNANVGTTMKGAIDDVNKLNEIVGESGIPNYAIHCDAALSGMILPFLENDLNLKVGDNIDSISVSGHKLIGCPFPCGIILSQKKHVDLISQSVQYIGCKDTTISGSRNGLSAIFLDYAISKHGVEGFSKIANRLIKDADYLVEELNNIGLKAYRNKYSTVVYFEKPDQKVIDEWFLSTDGDYAHIVVMPHVTRNVIDRFLKDLV